MNIQLNIKKKSTNDKLVFDVDVYRDDKYAYTITEEEFKALIRELSKNRHDVSNETTLIDTIKENWRNL